ncbi:MAG: class I SAM-dependent methyltransferase [Thermodesulfobacteriota bacterium]
MNASLMITKSALMRPHRVMPPHSWVGHIPFGAWLVEQTEPRLLVELGTHTGNSYFSFCQSVLENGLSTRCHAVDTWQGDEQSGLYGEEVYQSVREHNQRYYSGFSNLLRMTFDEAVAYFSDGSIDFLHIDGLHTYDAVKHDFDTWRPKLSEKAVVVLHDTDVRERDFGVWRLWEELVAVHPHLGFHHSHGLGVLLVGAEQPESLRRLTEEWSRRAEGHLLRRFFGAVGRGIEFEWRTADLESKAGALGRSLLERDGRIADLIQEAAEKDRRLAELGKKIEALDGIIADRAERIDILIRAVDDRERRMNRLSADRDRQVEAFQEETAELQRQIRALQGTAADLQASTSWRITAPMRWTMGFLRALAGPCLWRPLRLLYHGLPLSYETRYRMRSFVFRHSGGLFRHSPSYQAWMAHERACPDAEQTSVSLHAPHLSPEEVLAFPEPAVPEISIIVPLHDHPESSLRNLKSLLDTLPDEECEVILVTDRLDEEDRERIFSRIAGARMVPAEGSGMSVWLAGAKAAKGARLVFLRGDVHASPGWLRELAWVFRHTVDAGLAGATVVRADGCIWAAGGQADEEGGLLRMGSGEDPAHPAFHYLREVDFCPAFAIMIPRDLFFGGAAEMPSDCSPEEEGMYLAMAVRAAGRKAYHQPLSRVVLNPHSVVCRGIGDTEGMTEKKRSSGFRLGRDFAGAFVKAALPRGNLLIIDEWTPTPDQDSGSQDLVSYFLILRSLGFSITFIPAADLRCVEPYTRDLQRIGVQCLHAPFVRDIGAYLEAHGQRFELVMIYRPHCAAAHVHLVRRFCPRAKIVYNTVDLHYLREERQAAVENSAALAEQAARTKELELSVIRRVDATILLSPVEKELLLREAGVTPESLFVIPLIRGDFPGADAGFEERRGVVFIGGFQHRPNVDAVIWFGTEIWPLIRKKLPQVECFVIGKNAPQAVLDLSGGGISILGHVPDIAPRFSACRIAVAPIRYGAGLKGKVVTSLGYGVPCVATTMAVEGTGLRDGEEILIADDPAAFARAVVNLHEQQELWNHLSVNGRAYIQRRYSLEAGKDAIRRMLADLGLMGFPDGAAARNE